MIHDSHQVTMSGDRVTIHDLELFVGYDPSIDNPDNERIKKFDRDKVKSVVKRTREYIKRGQSPKLICGHNPKDPDKADGYGARPTIGDIPSIRMVNIGGVAGIVGDVVMAASDFESYVKNNSFPRRSAEIWPDGFLSEVALLGATTPARPIPDTRFKQLAREHAGLDVFERDCPPGRFEATMGEPGPHSVSPPRTGGAKRKRVLPLTDKRSDMPNDDDDRKDEDHDDDEDKDEMSRLRAKVIAQQDELDGMKAQLSKFTADDEDKDKSARTMELERDDFERQVEQQSSKLARLEKDLRSEKYGRRIDELRIEGYKVGDRKQQAVILERVIRAEDPDKELNFLKDMMGKDPINMHIDMRGARTDGGNRQQAEREARAAEVARDKCLAEKVYDDPEKFKRYFEEALAVA